MEEKKEESIFDRKACDNYVNGFYGEYGLDSCENCGERKGKHECLTNPKEQ